MRSHASLPRRARALLLGAGLLLLLAAVPAASAHIGLGGGETVEFRLPAWVIWLAGGLVVALSFAVIAAFLSRETDAQGAYGRNLLAPAGAHRVAQSPPAGETGITPLRLLGLALLLLVIANGFRPTSTSLLPLAVFWLGLWVMLPLIAYTLGDVWPRIDPFRALAPLTERLRGGRPALAYPSRLGAWPATVLFLLLVGLEVSGAAWAQSAAPLGRIALAYTLLVLVGMSLFGARAWLTEAEVIGRALRWWHAVSPLAWQNGRPRWRGVTTGLAALPTARLDGAAFTIAILYGVNHDAFMHTASGAWLLAGLAHLHVPLPTLVLLALGYGVFLAIWLAAARSMRDAAESLAGVRVTAARFAASLLPIAAAYHLAHNIPYLWQNLPVLVYGLLDPLGTAGWPGSLITLPEALPLAARLLPYLAAAQVLIIILGHLIAVVAAHRIAKKLHPSRVQAVLAETPLTLVMVVYTGIGLSLLGAKGVLG